MPNYPKCAICEGPNGIHRLIIGLQLGDICTGCREGMLAMYERFFEGIMLAQRADRGEPLPRAELCRGCNLFVSTDVNVEQEDGSVLVSAGRGI